MTQHFTPETEYVDFYDAKKNDLMAAINSLNRLNCYEEWRKYQTSCMASRFNCLIKLNQNIFNSSRFVRKNYFFFCLNHLIVYR
jgi:hypothetical protein